MTGIVGRRGITAQLGTVGFKGIATGGGAPVWTPASLTNLLWWYDIYDLSKMWTTSDKTTNVAADGDPVGYIEDSSGNGHDIQQTVLARRFIFRTNGTLNWLEGTAASIRGFNTVNTVDMTGGNTVTSCLGCSVNNVAGNDFFIEHSANVTTNNGAFIVYYGSNVSYRMGIKGTGTFREIATANIAQPNTRVIVGRGTLGGTYSIRQNQTETSASLDSGGGNFGNYTTYFGFRLGSLGPVDGNIYSLFAYTDIKSGADLTAIEEYIAEKSGVTL
jgi:hypothetical protein